MLLILIAVCDGVRNCFVPDELVTVVHAYGSAGWNADVAERHAINSGVHCDEVSVGRVRDVGLVDVS
jgi:hypothetical protein